MMSVGTSFKIYCILLFDMIIQNTVHSIQYGFLNSVNSVASHNSGISEMFETGFIIAVGSHP